MLTWWGWAWRGSDKGMKMVGKESYAPERSNIVCLHCQFFGLDPMSFLSSISMKEHLNYVYCNKKIRGSNSELGVLQMSKISVTPNYFGKFQNMLKNKMLFYLFLYTYYNTEKALKTISAIMKMKSEMIVYINTYRIMKSGGENISFFVVQHPIWDGLSLFK